MLLTRQQAHLQQPPLGKRSCSDIPLLRKSLCADHPHRTPHSKTGRVCGRLQPSPCPGVGLLTLQVWVVVVLLLVLLLLLVALRPSSAANTCPKVGLWQEAGQHTVARE